MLDSAGKDGESVRVEFHGGNEYPTYFQYTSVVNNYEKTRTVRATVIKDGDKEKVIFTGGSTKGDPNVPPASPAWAGLPIVFKPKTAEEEKGYTVNKPANEITPDDIRPAVKELERIASGVQRELSMTAPDDKLALIAANYQSGAYDALPVDRSPGADKKAPATTGRGSPT